jgi:hypothetical protein
MLLRFMYAICRQDCEQYSLNRLARDPKAFPQRAAALLAPNHPGGGA